MRLAKCNEEEHTFAWAKASSAPQGARVARVVRGFVETLAEA